MIFRLCKSKTVLFIAVVLLLNFTVGFWFSGRVCAASEKYILGDANGDGKVNIHDVSYIQMILAEYPADDNYSELSADVDGNGEIDIVDATYIQQWLAEMNPPYPIAEQLDKPVETTSPETTTQSPTDAEGWGRDIFRP